MLRAHSEPVGSGQGGLLESAAGEAGGAAPAGTACAAAGSSPRLSHQSAHHTASAAAHTPEGKAVHMDGM